MSTQSGKGTTRSLATAKDYLLANRVTSGFVAFQPVLPVSLEVACKRCGMKVLGAGHDEGGRYVRCAVPGCVLVATADGKLFMSV